uniref:Peptidase M3A/M3B catalytic domain-containing protein n=1 Tax=Romanomermis culicivorax TaxID=13658 RepID=A0A915IGS5_ROMCU
MFEISYVDVSEEIETWHDSVKVYSIRDSTGEEKGLLYVDAFIRSGKLQSNWISHGRSKCQFNGYKPIVYLNVNIMKGEKLEELPISVEILLFLAKSLGDVMATMLCGSPYSSLSGAQSVELDASQFYAEVFKWIVLEPSILSRLSSNRLSVQDADIVREGRISFLEIKEQYFTELYIESMLPILLREGFLSEFDMAINHASGRIFWRDIYADMYTRYYEKQLDKMDNYPCSFTDIMLKGSSCGYYGQLWSEMLACDVVAAFKEAGCFENDEKLIAMGKRYKETFLNQGGGVKMRRIFENFRNRDLDFKHLFDFYKL